jgi:hypothetical protein
LTNTTTSITVTAPAGSSGTVDVTVTSAGGTSSTTSNDRFTYVARPAVTGVSPSTGTHLGGTTVTITGTNLLGASAVHFGANLGTILTVTATSITVRSPAGSGTVDVTVTTAGGTSATSSTDHFNFI